MFRYDPKGIGISIILAPFKEYVALIRPDYRERLIWMVEGGCLTRIARLETLYHRGDDAKTSWPRVSYMLNYDCAFSPRVAPIGPVAPDGREDCICGSSEKGGDNKEGV